METIAFDSHGTKCAAWYLEAESDELQSAAGRPCVVMGHGFGATRDAGLLPFAERFAAAGIDALVFDYRGFGTSDGRPRQDVNHRKHRQDYHSAIAAARARTDVDPARIAIWGSSYSGGHVVAVAAQDSRVAAVISQGAAMDGLAALLMVRATSGLGKVVRLTGVGLRDLGRAVTRRDPYLVPIVGAPGTRAVIVSPGAEQGYQAIMGPTFRNEMRARGILRLAANRPVTMARRVRAPMLLVVAEEDNVAPASAVRAVARKAGGHAEMESFACGHFDIYLGEIFEKSVSRQAEFLRDQLETAR
jgi:pimeloyl-ACP methyl ester carboxylesterase